MLTPEVLVMRQEQNFHINLTQNPDMSEKSVNI